MPIARYWLAQLFPCGSIRLNKIIKGIIIPIVYRKAHSGVSR